MSLLQSPFAEVFGTILLPVLSIVGLGYGVAHAGILTDSRTMARIALFLCIPALAFTSMAKSSLSTTESFVLLASPWFLGGAMHLVGGRLARLLHFERVTTSGFLLSIMTANTGNFGIPVHQFAFGPEGLVRAALYFVGSTTFFFTVGVFTASNGSRPTAQSLTPIFRLPLLYAAAAGLLVNFLAIELPVACARTAETLAGAAVPMMLLALGSALANARTAEEIWGLPVACAMGLKRIGAPLAAWLFTWLLGLDGLTRKRHPCPGGDARRGACGPPGPRVERGTSARQSRRLDDHPGKRHHAYGAPRTLTFNTTQDHS